MGQELCLSEWSAIQLHGGVHAMSLVGLIWKVLTLPLLPVSALLLLVGAVTGSLHTTGLAVGIYAWFLVVAAVAVLLHAGAAFAIWAAAERVAVLPARGAARWCALAAAASGALCVATGQLAWRAQCDDYPPCGFAVRGTWNLSFALVLWIVALSVLVFGVAFVRFVSAAPRWPG